jgi:hypothetical protein
MKNCNTCLIEKNDNEFWKKLNGLQPSCKNCMKAKNKVYRVQNNDKLKQIQKDNYYKNHEERLLKNKESYEKNKTERILYEKNKRQKIKEDIKNNGLSLKNITEKKCSKCKVIKPVTEFYIKKTQNAYFDKCKDCQKSGAKKYRKENKPKINAYMKKYLKTENGSDRRLQSSLRNRLSKFIFSDTDSKTNIKNKLLGCSKSFLKKWILFNLEYDVFQLEEYGLWHIDHVIPCSKFNLKNDDDVKKCFHWTNTSPLEKFKNLSKSDKIIWPYIFMQEIRLKQFAKKNQVDDLDIKYWINNVLTTAY